MQIFEHKNILFLIIFLFCKVDLTKRGCLSRRQVSAVLRRPAPVCSIHAEHVGLLSFAFLLTAFAPVVTHSLIFRNDCRCV